MFYLRLLGGASIEQDGAPLSGTVAQRRRLAFLALLAESFPAGMSRERLAALLFPDADAARAHRALSDALHAVRRVLGKEAVVAAGDELRLDESIVRADVREFEAALEAGALEQAVALYRGPFLDGFAVPDALELQHWADAERDRLARRHVEALERLAARSEATGDRAGTVEWLRRLATLDPLNSRTAARLALAMDGAGDRAGALRHAKVHEAMLRGELGIDPPAELRDVIARLKSGEAARTAGDRATFVRHHEPEPAASVSHASAPSDDSALSRAAATSPRARWLRTHRRALTISGAVLLLLVVVLVPIARRLLDSRRASLPVDANTIVVFPISAERDEELTALGRDIAELVGRNLDGAGDLRVVHPARVARRSDEERADGRGLDVDRESAIASALGAGRFVTGRIAGSAARVRVHLVLYETGRADLPIAEATANRPADDLLGLADHLSAELVGALAGPASRRAVRTAAATSSSPAALKEFLRAEQAYRRADYDVAIAGFQRAVSLDDTFALAYFRLAVASGLYDREPNVSAFALEGAAPTALERALAFQERLPERDRQLLLAYATYRRGEADEAERLYREILRDYPDDIEARFLLAELQFRYNAMRGRDPAESRGDYEAVLRVDPDFFCPI